MEPLLAGAKRLAHFSLVLETKAQLLYQTPILAEEGGVDPHTFQYARFSRPVSRPLLSHLPFGGIAVIWTLIPWLTAKSPNRWTTNPLVLSHWLEQWYNAYKAFALTFELRKHLESHIGFEPMCIAWKAIILDQTIWMRHLVAESGFEPLTSWLWAKRTTTVLPRDIGGPEEIRTPVLLYQPISSTSYPIWHYTQLLYRNVRCAVSLVSYEVLQLNQLDSTSLVMTPLTRY